MTLRFVLPAIHRRPTGGNIYNRHIAAELRKLPGFTRDIALVDSLMLDHVPEGTSVLIARRDGLAGTARSLSRSAEWQEKWPGSPHSRVPASQQGTVGAD